MRETSKEAERHRGGKRWRYVIGRYLKTLAWDEEKEVGKEGTEVCGYYDVIFTIRRFA